MSYVYSNEMKYADSASLDAFGRLRTSDITTLLDVKHLYDGLPNLVDEKIGSGSTASWTQSSIRMATTASGGYVVRQTIKSAPYQSGKSQLVEGSFSNFQIETNVVKRVGYYTAATASPYDGGFDGFFLESNGVSNAITFQLWKGGTQVFSATSSSWLTDEYDASLIDWSKTQLMLVDFQWLGVGRLRFYMVQDGIPRLFHTHAGMNNLTSVYMDNPNKPIRYEIRQSGAGSGSLYMICAGVSMEGSINSLYRPIAINDFTERTLATNGTTYAMLGIRLGRGYRGVSGFLDQVDILQTSNDNFLVTIQRSPTISGTASWTSSSDSPIEYSFGAGNLSVSTTGHLIKSMMGKSGAVSQSELKTDDSAFSLGHGIDGTPDEWWICIQATGDNAKMRTGVNLKYFK